MAPGRQLIPAPGATPAYCGRRCPTAPAGFMRPALGVFGGFRTAHRIPDASLISHGCRQYQRRYPRDFTVKKDPLERAHISGTVFESMAPKFQLLDWQLGCFQSFPRLRLTPAVRGDACRDSETVKCLDHELQGLSIILTGRCNSSAASLANQLPRPSAKCPSDVAAAADQSDIPPAQAPFGMTWWGWRNDLATGSG